MNDKHTSCHRILPNKRQLTTGLMLDRVTWHGCGWHHINAYKYVFTDIIVWQSSNWDWHRSHGFVLRANVEENIRFVRQITESTKAKGGCQADLIMQDHHRPMNRVIMLGPALPLSSQPATPMWIRIEEHK